MKVPLEEPVPSGWNVFPSSSKPLPTLSPNCGHSAGFESWSCTSLHWANKMRPLSRVALFADRPQVVAIVTILRGIRPLTDYHEGDVVRFDSLAAALAAAACTIKNLSP